MKSQGILDKLPVRRDIAAHQVDMVDSLDRGTTPCILLRLIDELWTQLWRSHIFLHLVIDLHPVAIGVFELVGAAMPNIPLNPSFPSTGCLEGLHPSIERLRAPGAPANMP